MTSTASLLPLLGVDFSCAPSRRKPITVARGTLHGAVLRLERVDELPTLAGFEAVLAERPWFGGFDFPFGLPRAFVDDQGLGSSAAEVVAELRRRCPARMDFRALVDAWGNGRPPGQRLVHRRTDVSLPGTTSSSPLQTRYVPVGFMYYEGFSRLVAAGVQVPGLVAGDSERRAVEAYPGLLAAEILGRRSYKNSEAADRLIARKDLVDALEQGRTRLGLRLKLTHAQRDALVADASGDRLDAALCLLQAGWASLRDDAGIPADVDPVEGWIVTA
ncbi:DUF429 domain-containing protein [Rubrivivax gelatinosus]|uniref:DUF429 domain-containing protein n=1 Tax=Rubrivivax gelatinosus (strain NBRC 100245 / IL144) TaxID=983917 RepID=I0HVT7_RUBGI|nr:DUF429 domain-containing protein [Rubrivivax gelatinosus]BAL97124.1 hypothetical protein RGE_37850 [Rubrivivax gelatinosus IL144]